MENDATKAIEGFAQATLTAFIALVQTLPQEQRTQLHQSLKKYRPDTEQGPVFVRTWQATMNRVVQQTR